MVMACWNQSGCGGIVEMDVDVEVLLSLPVLLDCDKEVGHDS